MYLVNVIEPKFNFICLGIAFHISLPQVPQVVIEITSNCHDEDQSCSHPKWTIPEWFGSH